MPGNLKMSIKLSNLFFSNKYAFRTIFHLRAVFVNLSVQDHIMSVILKREPVALIMMAQPNFYGRELLEK